MAYIRNFRGSSGNRAIISGSNVQVTGSLFASTVSGTTSQFTSLDSVTVNIANGNNLTWGGAYASGNPTIAGSSAAEASRIGFYPRGNLGSETVTIHASGNVGIGTNSPSRKLHVFNGDILLEGAGNLVLKPASAGSNGIIKFQDAAGALKANMYSAGTDMIRISDSAGTDKLIIDSAGSIRSYCSDAQLVLQSYNTSATNAQQAFIAHSLDSVRIGNSRSNGKLTFETNATTAVTIDGSQNVGIGVSSPNAKLDVSLQSTTSTSSYVAEFRNSSTTQNAGRFMWSQGSTYALTMNVQGTATTSATADLQFINRSTGATQSTPITLKYNGDISIPNGNIVIGTSGKGIDFAITSPDGTAPTAELLDDYEKGTWTPSFNATGTSWGYAAQSGEYVKIGSLVYASFTLTTNNISTPNTNGMSISGFPFASSTSNFSTCQIWWLGLPTAVVNIYGLLASSATAMVLYVSTTTAQVSSVSMTSNYTDGGCGIRGCMIYRTT